MGRITIFTEEKCCESSLLRALLSDNGIPYEEVSLTMYPGKYI